MYPRPRRLPVAALLVAVVVAVGGCVPAVPEESPDDGSGGASRPSSAASAPVGAQEDGTMTAAEFRGDIRSAAQLAEDYWKTRVRGFQPIPRIIEYAESGEVACGGQALERNNAAYCAADDFIAYDVNWAVQAFRRIGDAFLFYLLGHEYAHGVQVRLGIRYDFTISQELQADCMAGAYLGDTIRDGALRLQEGDLDEFRRGLLAVGDDPGQPWFAEGAHGTAEQRTAAFFNGYEDSLAACDL
jgi:predicted metalloprotease